MRPAPPPLYETLILYNKPLQCIILAVVSPIQLLCIILAVVSPVQLLCIILAVVSPIQLLCAVPGGTQWDGWEINHSHPLISPVMTA